MNIIFFSHNVFKRLHRQGRENLELFGIELTLYQMTKF